MGKFDLFKPIVSGYMSKAIEGMKKAANEMDKALKEFDETNIDEFLANAEKSMKVSFDKVKSKFVEDTKDEMTIFIPYDRNTDTLTTSIEGNVFKAVAKTEDGTSERSTSIYIPDDVDVTSEIHNYDEDKHIMNFIFKKKKK